MAVVRVNKTSDFTVMSNTHFKERKMSLKAKGLLSLMLSLPDEWDYSVRGLMTLSKDGKVSVMNALAELEEFGYLKMTRAHDEKGRFAGYDYDIFETPYSEKPDTDNPDTENPYSEKPDTENQPQLNTNTLNINLIKKECIKDEEDKPDYTDEEDMLLPFKKNLMLSENQIGDLLDKMGLEAFDEYVFRLSSYIEQTGYIVKNHYKTILKWYNEDRGVTE
jgi:hypothetical protein